MDIAKIRKKAREKEKEPRGEDDLRAHEEQTGVAAGEEQGVGDVAAEPVVLPESGGVDLVRKERDDREDMGLDEGSPLVPEEKTELLTFRSAGKEFAFRLEEVEEIVRYQHMTRVPTLPPYVRGITSLRGKVIPVIDVGVRLGVVKPGDTGLRACRTEGGDTRGRNEKIIIVTGPKGLIGALVDNVLGVVRFPEKELLEPPAHLSEEELRFVEGVAILDKRFISIVRSEDTMDLEVS